ncbi:phenylalanine--tRNA ligase beta subunit-related protein [Pseudomonas sp. CHM02]|uniref:phenylalanine--tRNA ligase beta subunit-related protein n=1 Tax=Pseudomonas sp. CHM02 TaxID=1463662 RepID=UPI000472A45A|nr:phenylalanine--tRNA ligase beta subunit-related protein [Pseudomonas sp. CHM02]
MNSRLIIKKSACELGINNACAAVIEDITVSNDQSFVAVLQSNLNHVASRLNELESNIVYEGFAKQLKKLGYENTVSANEKLLRRFIAKGVYSINNIVDAYNAVAIRHGVSIGVHTYHQQDDIYVMRSDKPRVLRPLFAKKPITIPVGDIVYTCGDVPLASIGKVDADAHDFRLTKDSSRLLVVILGHDDTSLTFNQAVIEELVDTLRQKMPNLSHHFLETVRDRA